MKYFAYGTNLNIKQMSERCPYAEFISQAEVSGYKFIFNSRGTATIIPAEGFKVYGVLYEIDKKCLKELDKYEGVSKGVYNREETEVISKDGEQVRAIVYIANDSTEGSPRKDHWDKILEGAQENNLPDEYIKDFKNRYEKF